METVVTVPTAAERKKRVVDNLDLVKFVYRRIATTNWARRERDDLISEGNLALCEAANKWTDDIKATFRTYASRCIEKKMLAYLKKESLYQKTYITFTDLEGDNGEVCL